jgi:hypothetical protein
MHQDPFVSIPVSEFESLAERASLVERLQQRLDDEHARQRRLLEQFVVPWPPEHDFYATVGSYIETLQAALRLRQTFKQ